MIRKLTGADIDETATIWLETNIKAHDFISTEYWQSNFDMVKEMLLQAELYVYESEGSIQGFIGLNDEYIAGLFVSEQAQSHGIGKCLLNFMKDQKRKLYTEREDRMRILIDTNILFSALLFPNSKPSRVLLYIANHHEIVLCDRNGIK